MCQEEELKKSKKITEGSSDDPKKSGSKGGEKDDPGIKGKPREVRKGQKG